MAPTKLSDSDRQDILDRYRQPGETTSTLASRFGVSSTTVSRILKRGLSPEEYEALVQQKRAVSSKDSLTKSTTVSPSAPKSGKASVNKPGDNNSKKTDKGPRPNSEQTIEQPTLFQTESSQEDSAAASAPSPVVKDAEKNLQVLSGDDYDESAEEFTEILDEDADGDIDDLDEDEDFEDSDEFDDASEDGEEDETIPFKLPEENLLQVLPLAEARLPKTCYLVIDRGAELVTRPLRDFGELGQLPEEEVQARTLPVFDNHRVARRFSRRTQKIVKVPNGELFYKTSSYLQAKGITRLLVDGQVYSL